MNKLFYDLMNSWNEIKGINSTVSLLDWIDEQNTNLEVDITRISLNDSEFWYYDNNSGSIVNQSKSFFSIFGIQQYHNASLIIEQPIIKQDEIGFLGLICRKIDGIYHFLMQAKIEPGNINKVQLSPTIQATKSNFMQKHGGRTPAFFEYFLNAKQEQILVDQIQSEQSSRFLKKRNRNVILIVDEPIKESSTHRWMTLGQIKSLMRYNNLVNMDTRTVIAQIPFSLMKPDFTELAEIEARCKDKSLLHSITGIADHRVLTDIFHFINDYKMFYDLENRLVDLYSLKHWHMKNDAFVCDQSCSFQVIFCNISIEGREVRNWTQPLFEAKGMATFGLICCVDEGIKKFLVRVKPEIGCFDGIELGPTVQKEVVDPEVNDEIVEIFFQKYSEKDGIIIDVILSEEGGRFYHEQNRNVIIEIDKDELPELPYGYFWCDFRTLNFLIQINNCLNIQLRNLLSLMEV